MTAKQLIDLLEAPRWSVHSAIRDLRRHEFVEAYGEGKAFLYKLTPSAVNFTHIPKRARREKAIRQPRPSPASMVQKAVRTVPNRVFALGGM